ncbi:MAG TPA: dipeptide ABC transporter ATP-binding protein [Polyangiaceae bacterium]|nr:dipeptide ABC transporter ATP-binding protein [Polyangiaceae bacterium]
MTQPLLSIRDLSVSFRDKTVVRHLDLDIQPGERLALVGESGSGKTVTAHSILRLLAGARFSGSIRLGERELLQASERELRSVRGAEIAMIFQEPMVALNPLFSIGSQIVETLVLHEGLSPKLARKRAQELLERTGVREPERRIDAFPHELSGGERQRAMIAMALACRPQLLIADEPTTALDPTLRMRILELLFELQEQERKRRGDEGMAILLITHDLPLVRKFAERVAVMEHGRLVEVGSSEEVFQRPRHEYTKKLLDAEPTRVVSPLEEEAPLVLSTQDLRVEYRRRTSGPRGWFASERFVALEAATISLRAGETVGIVGESGSGKSTLARAILDLVPVRGGSLLFGQTSLRGLRPKARRALAPQLQVVFQDPFASLSPRQTVRQIVGEGLRVHRQELTAAEVEQRVVRALDDVGLGIESLDSFPHEFSGGQRQRIAIARALVLEPQVLILDEPTSALDLSIQRQVLDLLVRIQRRYGIAYRLISHDLAVINALAHRVYVLRAGRVLESGDTEAVIRTPRDPYTRALIQAST